MNDETALTKYPKMSMIDRRKIIYSVSKISSELMFVEIGANDGIECDPNYFILENINFKGIFVEPIKEPFEKLKKNYKGKENVFFENSAIGLKDGLAKFYINQDYSINPIRSTLAATLKKEGNVNFKKGRVKEIDVNCLTWSTFFEKYKKEIGIKKIDMVHLDTKGLMPLLLIRFWNIPKKEMLNYLKL